MSSEGATACGLSCPAGTVASGTACIVPFCPAGAFLNGQACALCAPGTFSANGAAAACAPCADGLVSGAGATSCTAVCPSIPGATATATMQPQYPTGAACGNYCPGGTYPIGPAAPGVCSPCPPGAYNGVASTVVGAAVCQACPAGKFSAYGATVCGAQVAGTAAAPKA